jgi:hypothetical protein
VVCVLFLPSGTSGCSAQPSPFTRASNQI